MAGWLHQGDWSLSAELHKAAASNLGSIERIHGGIPQKILIAFSGQYRNISTVLEVLIANENNEVVFLHVFCGENWHSCFAPSFPGDRTNL